MGGAVMDDYGYGGAALKNDAFILEPHMNKCEEVVPKSNGFLKF